MTVIAANLFGWIVPNSVIWLIACVLLAIIETLTVGLITIWFALGAFVASVVSIFTDNFLLQVIVFLLVSIIALAFTRPLFKKYMSKEIVKTNADSLVGDRGVVTVAIKRNRKGRVSVSNQDWAATTQDGSEIEIGTEIIVTGISGVSLVVEVSEEL